MKMEWSNRSAVKIKTVTLLYIAAYSSNFLAFTMNIQSNNQVAPLKVNIF